MGAEKRRHERVAMKQKVAISYHTETAVVTEEVHTRDLSVGGAKIASGSEYPLTSIVKMEIHLPDDTVTVLGSVRYVCERNEPPPFDLGIKFIGLNEDESDKLKRAVSRIETVSGG